MKEVIDFLRENWSEIIVAIVGVASVIVKFTPGTKDNTLMNSIINLLDKFSVAKTANDKEKLRIAKEDVESLKKD